MYKHLHALLTAGERAPYIKINYSKKLYAGKKKQHSNEKNTHSKSLMHGTHFEMFEWNRIK